MTALHLNESLIRRNRRVPRKDSLTFEECVALNLFRRRGVRLPVLCAAFQAGKNAIYYHALTGGSTTYPDTIRAELAKRVNELIDRIGEEEAFRRYVTPDQVRAVNEALETNVLTTQSQPRRRVRR